MDTILNLRKLADAQYAGVTGLLVLHLLAFHPLRTSCSDLLSMKQPPECRAKVRSQHVLIKVMLDQPFASGNGISLLINQYCMPCCRNIVVKLLLLV